MFKIYIYEQLMRRDSFKIMDLVATDSVRDNIKDIKEDVEKMEIPE